MNYAKYLLACSSRAAADKLSQGPHQPSLANSGPFNSSESFDQSVSECRISSFMQADMAKRYPAHLIFRHPKKNSGPASQALDRKQAIAIEEIGELVAVPKSDGPGQLFCGNEATALP